jgi:hypothetical protein
MIRNTTQSERDEERELVNELFDGRGRERTGEREREKRKRGGREGRIFIEKLVEMPKLPIEQRVRFGYEDQKKERERGRERERERTKFLAY